MKINLTNVGKTDSRIRLIPQSGATSNITDTTNPTLMKDGDDVIMCLAKPASDLSATLTEELTPNSTAINYRFNFVNPSLLNSNSKLKIWTTGSRNTASGYQVVNFPTGDLTLNLLSFTQDGVPGFLPYGETYLVEAEVTDINGKVWSTTSSFNLPFKTPTIFKVTGPGVLRLRHDSLAVKTTMVRPVSRVMLDDKLVEILSGQQNDNVSLITVPEGQHEVKFDIQPGVTTSLRVFGDTAVDQHHTPVGDEAKVTEVVQFGEGVSNFAFVGHSQLTKVPATLPKDLKTLYRTFAGCPNLNDPNITNWNTGNLTSGEMTFIYSSKLNLPLNWDTSNFTTLYMFLFGASEFAADISNLCVGLIPEKEYGFSTGTKLNTLKEPRWGTCPSKTPLWEVINGSINSSNSVLSTTGETIDLPSAGIVRLTGAKVYIDGTNLTQAYIKGMSGASNSVSTGNYDFFIGASKHDVSLHDWMDMTHDDSFYFMSKRSTGQMEVFFVEDAELNQVEANPYFYYTSQQPGYDPINNFAGFKLINGVVHWGNKQTLSNPTSAVLNQQPVYPTDTGFYVYVMVKSKTAGVIDTIGLVAQ